MEFKNFQKAVQDQFNSIKNHRLFAVDIDKDTLWKVYLSSFPEGTNPIFRERTEHDCQCCKQFIRACGNMVAIVDNRIVSIWDVEVEEPYQTVANKMAEKVKSLPIKDVFLHYEKKVGTKFNKQMLDSGEVLTWNHFYLDLPSKVVKGKDYIGTKLSEYRSGKEVFKRGLEEISFDAIETVLELIEQKSIYRGEENKSAVESFLKCKKEFDKVENKDNYAWQKSVEIEGLSRIRNTAIGTLLVDITEGMELDKAVKSFESKVAPANYKRPTAVITKRMIEEAQKKVKELGIEGSLKRRYATIDDITINNILFADRSAKEKMDIFDEMKKEAPVKTKSFNKVEEVDIATFINSVIPKSESIEVFFENRHANNLVTLITSEEKDAESIFKWDNNFSWSYEGEVTDSIKERVKNAGGNVEGILRCSLSWFNYDDLDIHVIEPNGNEIFYSNKKSSTSGQLDVDMNAGSGKTRSAVENIVWTNKQKMLEGRYKLFVRNFEKREAKDVGFDIEMEYDGKVYTFHYDKAVLDNRNVVVAEFDFSKENGITFVKSIPSEESSKEFWNINTQNFHKVSVIMNSPNYWDDKEIGNKHYFFMLEDCKKDGKARGFFNEFLKEDFRKHRKVFEVLGSKMKAEESDNQLSGLGFSSTKKDSLYCRVNGSFSRIVKITI